MIVIIDYGMGNVGSVKNAVEALGQEALVSCKLEEVKRATHVIMPGVGAFADAMLNVRGRGLDTILTREVVENGKPFLGLCLGMQILADIGEEWGETKGLGWIRGRVRRFQVREREFRLPHIGWNDVAVREGARLFQGVKRPIFYFVHSYHFVTHDESVVSGHTEYGERFVSAMEKDNIFGLQFHPEKSQREGLRVLENFLNV